MFCKPTCDVGDATNAKIIETSFAQFLKAFFCGVIKFSIILNSSSRHCIAFRVSFTGIVNFCLPVLQF
jgi:hypothetical protein